MQAAKDADGGVRYRRVQNGIIGGRTQKASDIGMRFTKHRAYLNVHRLFGRKNGVIASFPRHERNCLACALGRVSPGFGRVCSWLKRSAWAKKKNRRLVSLHTGGLNFFDSQKLEQHF